MSNIGEQIIKSLREFTEGLRGGKRPKEATMWKCTCMACGRTFYTQEVLVTSADCPGCQRRERE